MGVSTPREQQNTGLNAAGGNIAPNEPVIAQASGSGIPLSKGKEAKHLSGQEEDREQQEQERAEQLHSALLQLPPIARQHLVPLYEIVRRVVARAYSELQSLVEV